MSYEAWRITYQDGEQAARAAYAEAARLRAELAALKPEDPMDWKLPCDVTVGHGTVGKGCKLRTLVLRMKSLYALAMGETGLKREPSAVTPGLIAIAQERARQIAEEGWTAEHDDAHSSDELAMAAACYALPHTLRPRGYRRAHSSPPAHWPWIPAWWKPAPLPTYREGSPRPRIADRIRELTKAGALIAAEIDRLIRQG